MASIDLKSAIERRYCCSASLVGTVPVRTRIVGDPMMERVVHVFDLVGSPKSHRAYGWSSRESLSPHQFFATSLHIGPVNSPAEAVCAVAAEEQRVCRLARTLRSLATAGGPRSLES